MSTLAQFKQTGFVVVKNLLSSQEVADYKAKLQQLSGLSDRHVDGWKRTSRDGVSWNMADGVSKNPEFWSLIVHPRLLSTIREILGSSARYSQHSDLHVHRAGAGWHRDNAHRTYGEGPDWDESEAEYQVVRVAFYLQSYTESGSSLILIPGSHRYEERLSVLETKLREYSVRFRRFFQSFTSPQASYLQSKIRTTPAKFLSPPAQPVYLNTEPGDCIIFDTRVVHSGSPIYGPKYAIFLSYGADNHHSRNHRRYYLHTRQDLNYQEFHPDLTDKLKAHDLLLELPVSSS